MADKIARRLTSSTAMALAMLAASSPARAAGVSIADMAAAPSRLNPTNHDVTLTAPLRDGPNILGEATFTLKADDSLLVDAARLLTLLKPVLTEESFSALANQIGSSGFATATLVEQAGFAVKYDPELISVSIAIPANARTSRTIRLVSLGDDEIGTFDQPASISGYINFRNTFDYSWQGEDRGLQDPLSLIDSAIRFHNIVLENEADLSLGGQRGFSFRRIGTRAVYDIVSRTARLTVGDLMPTSRGFSGTTQMTGVSLVRSYSVLAPQAIIQPTGQRSFTIARPSTVEAFINGQSVRQIRLDPGNYDVRDFPFAQGSNDVRLVITDDAGRSDVINFSLFFDRTLLARGLTEFGVYAGVRSPFQGLNRRYYFNEPVATGYIRRGLSDSFTAGANFHVQRRGGVLGGEAVLASPIGTVGADIAVSHVQDVGSGIALNASFLRMFGDGRSGRAVGLTVDFRSRDFATPDQLFAVNRYLVEIGATYSQAIGSRQYIALSGLYSKGRDGYQDQRTARLTYGNRLSRRLTLSAEAIYEKNDFDRRNIGARATLTFLIDRRSTAQAEVDTRGPSARLGYSTSRGEGVGALSLSGNLDYSERIVGGNANVAYIANRAELGFSHRTTYDVSGSRQMEQRSSFRVGTAIAFADGNVTLSRPIFDAFAMVKPHHDIADKTVYVSPRDGHYSARSDFLGAAVEPNLSSYVGRVINFDVPTAPVGYDLGSGNLRVRPPYRAGYLSIAGSDYSITAIGSLIGSDGKPISLLAGTAVELAAPDRPALSVFTNRNGRFGIAGLRAGKWRIDMPTLPPSSIVITVPAETKGVLRLNEIRMGEGQ